jgi:hypothetical protein
MSKTVKDINILKFTERLLIKKFVSKIPLDFVVFSNSRVNIKFTNEIIKYYVIKTDKADYKKFLIYFSASSKTSSLIVYNMFSD